MTTEITVLGLGNMGSALARALLATGHSVTVWNRTSSKGDPLVASGAIAAESVLDAVTASPLVVVCVVDDALVRPLLEPVANELRGRALVNLTNGTPGDAVALARFADAYDIPYLDGGIMAVPAMIGGKAASVLYSGDEAVYKQHLPTLQAFGAAEFLGTDPGLASSIDLALLSGMYGLFAGALHAFVLARAGGTQPTEFAPRLMPWLQAVIGSLAKAAGQIESGAYGEDVASPLAMQALALDNIARASAEAGLRGELVTPIATLLHRAVASGHGAHDIAAVVEQLAGAAAAFDARPERL